jgi:hypothetical protein
MDEVTRECALEQETDKGERVREKEKRGRTRRKRFMITSCRRGGCDVDRGSRRTFVGHIGGDGGNEKKIRGDIQQREPRHLFFPMAQHAIQAICDKRRSMSSFRKCVRSVEH